MMKKFLLTGSALLLFSGPVFAGRSCSISPLQFSCSDAFGTKRDYQDGGCSVSCGILQNAICKPAACDSFFGTANSSSCSCQRVLNGELESAGEFEMEMEPESENGFEERALSGRCVSCVGSCCHSGGSFWSAENACKDHHGDFGCFTSCN